MIRKIKNITPAIITQPKISSVHSPWNLKKIANVECINKKDANTILNIASKMFTDESEYLDKISRLKILKKSKNLLLKRSKDFAKLIALEGGKPLKDAIVEVKRAINGLELCAEALKNSHGREIPMSLNTSSLNKMAFTRKFPVGPVFAISAFNHPLNLIVHQVGPAVAAGCPIIIKPSIDTPCTCYEFVKLLIESGLPEGFCQMINTNNHATTQYLVSDSRISFFSFIGSADVGWKLKSMLSPGTKCAMEHGGVASVIIDKDVNLKNILPSLIRGSFYHAGQVCVSIQKIIVHEDIIEDFLNSLKHLIGKIKVGDPSNINTDVGPLIRPGEIKRVDRIIKEAIQEGAELICGGEPKSKTTYKCTVLRNPKKSSAVSQKEIFGPVVSVYSYNEINNAIDIANHDKYAFQSSVYTSNIDTAMHCYEKLEAKAVFINEQTAFRVDWMPFGGIKSSGEGVGGIEYTFSDLFYDKLLIINSKKITK